MTQSSQPVVAPCLRSPAPRRLARSLLLLQLELVLVVALLIRAGRRVSLLRGVLLLGATLKALQGGRRKRSATRHATVTILPLPSLHPGFCSSSCCR